MKLLVPGAHEAFMELEAHPPSSGALDSHTALSVLNAAGQAALPVTTAGLTANCNV